MHAAQLHARNSPGLRSEPRDDLPAARRRCEPRYKQPKSLKGAVEKLHAPTSQRP